MPEKLTWDEIKAKYPEEWVILTDHRIDGIEVVDGVVLDHGKVKREVDSRLADVPNGCAVLYTGEIRHGLIGVHAIDLDDEG
jgi:hypothetical protein